MKRAIGYIRRSAKSEENSVSLGVQRQAIFDYCNQGDNWHLDLVDIVEHDGFSGGDRKRYSILDHAVSLHGAEVVVVYNLDRFARDVAAQLDVLREFKKNGVELHVVGRGKVEIDTASGFLSTGVEALIAEHYRRVVSEKTKDALEELKAKGRRYSRHVPYGYRIEVDARIVPDEQEQQVLGVIRELSELAVYKRSARSIARLLTERGISARSGKPFAPSTIHGILKQLGYK